MAGVGRIDELVSSVSLHKTRPLLLQGTISPFVLPYLGWFYLWLVHYGLEDFIEGGFIGVAVIALLQVLTCLACYWSVHVQCFLACYKVLQDFLHVTSTQISCRRDITYL
jgi:cation-transporting ATPase 13A1